MQHSLGMIRTTSPLARPRTRLVHRRGRPPVAVRALLALACTLTWWPVGAPTARAAALLPAAPAAPSPSWSVVPTAGPGSTSNLLGTVACTSSTDCWAIGYQYAGPASQPLVERYEGYSWQAVPTPDTGRSYSYLLGLACSSSSSCWAVGYDSSGAGARALIEHYDGNSWTIDGSPLPAQSSALMGVTCVTTSDCSAVGQVYTGSAFQTLIEHYDGTSWQQVASNGPNGESYLQGITCVGGADCWAVGYAGSSPSRTLTEHYDGSAWSVVASPNTSSNSSNYLYRVSCAASADCWAVGSASSASGGSQTVTEHYAGTWSVVSSPSPGAGSNVLQDVSCVASTDCWAVGFSTDGGDSPDRTVAEHYNGSWFVVPTPDSGGGNGSLDGVTCLSASNCWAVGEAAPGSLAEHYTVPPAGRYSAVQPTRVCDTRAPQPGITANQCNNGSPRSAAPVGPGETLTLDVCNGAGIRCASSGVVLNVTVTGSNQSSYMTAYPTGASRPVASNLNFTPGSTVANLVEVAVGDLGTITLYNNSGSVDVIVDLEGTVAPVTSGPGLYTPLSPARICDTRPVEPGTQVNPCNNQGHGGTLGGNGRLNLQVAGQGGVPSSGIYAVALNVTTTAANSSSYLTVWPAGSAHPTASNVNWVAGQTVPNRVIVPVNRNGQVSLYNLQGSVDVVVDVNGWYADGTQSPESGAQFTAITPTRTCDTRPNQPGVGSNQCNNGGSGGTLSAGQSMPVQMVVGGGPVPDIATAVVLNVTVTGATAPGFLTAWPADGTQPPSSDLNWTAGETVANLVVVKLSSSGQLDIFNSAGMTDVIVDVMGYYS